MKRRSWFIVRISFSWHPLGWSLASAFARAGFDFLGASSSEKASLKWDFTIPGKLRWGRGRRDPLIGRALRGNSRAEFPACLDVIDF